MVALLRTPVGIFQSLIYFDPVSFLSLPQQPSPYLSAGARRLPSGAILTGTADSPLLPITDLSRLPWREEAFWGYLLLAVEEKSGASMIELLFPAVRNGLGAHTEAWQTDSSIVALVTRTGFF